MAIRLLIIVLSSLLVISCSGNADDGAVSQAEIDKAASNPGAQNMMGGEPLSRGGQNKPGAAPGQQKFGIGK